MKAFFLVFILFFVAKLESQTISKYIVTDQFGYRPVSEKIAVLRDPITGYDANESFTPGNTYALVNAENNTQVFTASPSVFNNGIEDVVSGDKTWWFNFSSYQTPGVYYILDIENNVKSYDFEIKNNVYEEVLKHAMRTFYYQRVGYAKEAQYAGEKWADGASHMGTLQDTQCRKFDTPNNPNSERDLSGGWFDAGDYNKYTPWTSNYIIELLLAYSENKDAWNDNYDLPYSGNGIPDIIDEARWGLDHLLKLQETNGSLISTIDLSHASPPSSATGQSLYGGVNTSSTLMGSAAYAHAAKFFYELGDTDYGDTLQQSAIKAWNWAIANPNVIWKNNSAEYNSVGIASGQQETDDYGRLTYKLRAAIYLYELTGDPVYNTFINSNFQDTHFFLWNYVYPFEQKIQEALLYYASLPNATPATATLIKNTYKSTMNSEDNFSAFNNEVDPYFAHLKDYVWGSNSTKAFKGLMFTDYINHDVNVSNNDDAFRAAERYVHYIHGVNPLNICYLSNMYEYGGDKCANEFYHTWFFDGTDWDNVQNDLYGPAPGFLVGGANPAYDWDNCCLTGCGGANCDTGIRDRMTNQPSQKSYFEFNTNWPMNSWEVTENSLNYQTAYVRLLSKYVGLNSVLSTDNDFDKTIFSFYPNPFSKEIQLQAKIPFNYEIYNLIGQNVTSGFCDKECKIGESLNKNEIYFLKMKANTITKTIKILKTE